jgi:drug/metabolite transporter (DMT)-like permease
MKGGYLLVLVALSLEQVSYILSIRQLSIVIGTVFGLKFLKEKNPRIKIFGSIIIFLGVYILGVLA